MRDLVHSHNPVLWNVALLRGKHIDKLSNAHCLGPLVLMNLATACFTAVLGSVKVHLCHVLWTMEITKVRG
jgi:hypothetical protein